jgi:asparagine synthase (glutamine-hydrolysing)
VDELLSDENIKQTGYFESYKVQGLLSKCRRQQGKLSSERENMALVGILSTQLVDYQFIRNFPAYPVQDLEDVKVYS